MQSIKYKLYKCAASGGNQGHGTYQIFSHVCRYSLHVEGLETQLVLFNGIKNMRVYQMKSYEIPGTALVVSLAVLLAVSLAVW